MKDQSWTHKLPTEPGLYWIKAPDGTVATFEYNPGIVWQPGFQFSGPILPPGHQPGPTTNSQYAHLTSTGFVRTVRGRTRIASAGGQGAYQPAAEPTAAESHQITSNFIRTGRLRQKQS